MLKNPTTTEESSNNTSTAAVIKVCHGPDCFGLGGGAVLLELEQLVTSSSSIRNTKVMKDGCRNLCSMGPNVHCRQVKTTTKNSNNDGVVLFQKHYSRVLGPEECKVIVKDIIREQVNDSEEDNETSNRDVVCGIMLSLIPGHYRSSHDDDSQPT